MEAVKQRIASILTLNDDTMEKLLAKLVEIGVANIGDLADVEIDDISPEILLPIPARKFLRICKASSDQAVMPSTSSVSPTTPRSSQPLQQLQTTPSGADPDWHRSFDIACTVNNMLSSKESMLSKQAAKALTEDKPLSPVFRNEIVRCLVIDILKENTGAMITRGQLNVIAEKMVTKYGKLKDEVDGCSIGSGYSSLRNQLENRISYLKRPASTQRKSGLKRRLTPDEDENNENKPRRIIRDGYGCIDFLPVNLPEGESDQSLSDKQDKLKELFKKTWNDTEISSLMNATYILQRQDLVGRKLNVAQMKEEWPFLLEPKFMLNHLEQLLGFSITDRLEQSLAEKRETMYEFFQSRASTVKQLRTELNTVDSEKPAIELIRLLMGYFGEKKEILFIQYEVNMVNFCEVCCNLFEQIHYIYFCRTSICELGLHQNYWANRDETWQRDSC